jgi:2-polyprenyl-3-methyl-5-hydroxy-6-metoxy-1,4-benzoquinol methylase
MTETTISCPLCISADTQFFSEDKLRVYLRCSHCQLVFVPKQFHLNAVDEQAQYDHHENNPNDSGYRKFLSRLADPLLERLTANSEGLDFGCGPGPCLSVMLEEQGHSVDLYDLYYADNKTVFEREYDFITATEVIEHLSRPMIELQRLWNLLKPGGYLGLMTKLVADAEKFANWHYKTDPTHISFFSAETFEYLGQQWGSRPVIIGADVIIFQKPQ